MSQPMLLHFTLGPVQGFISSARRTRDYWAGSFLLGYLSGVAMRAVQDGYGRIDFPKLTGEDGRPDAFYEAVCRRDPDSRQHIATLPNRFRARIERAAQFAHDRPCEKAVQAAWQGIAEAVWRQFLDRIPPNARPHTREIWDRQIQHFFEMAWVMGTDPTDGSDGNWLDRRKNWRSHVRLEEPGDHCRIMSEYQELSGWIRSTNRVEQDRFWDLVREQVLETLYGEDPQKGEYDLLELRNTERLCAVALVKRLFPVLPVATLKQVLGWAPDGPASAGRENRPGRLRFWPSAPYMAAIPWLVNAWREDQTACTTFTESAGRRLPVEAVAERESRVRSLAQSNIKSFGMLDGGLFFEDAQETEITAAKRAAVNLGNRLAELPAGPERARLERELRRVQASRGRREEVLGALQELIERLMQAGPEQQTHRQRRFDRAPEFYALLLMDGDGGGALMKPSRLGAEVVSRGFGHFQSRVMETVAAHDGVLIYGGADDVQALLPLGRAVDCAIALHDAYLQAFADVLANERQKLRTYPATTSAGLVLAHYHVPLASVIREAHTLLDDVAKEGNGRNSIAIVALKPSGPAARYVTAFARERHEETREGPIDHLMQLARNYAADPVRSSSFIYNVRERFGEVLMPDKGDPLLSPESDELKLLLHKQWTKGREEEADAGAVDAVNELLRVCRAYRRLSSGGVFSLKEVFRLDGALIAKFLADNGIGARSTF